MRMKELSIDDARQFAALMLAVEASAPFMLMEAGERVLTAEQAATFINKENITVIGAEDAARLVGYILVIRETARKKKHSASVVVGVHIDYRGKGVGTQLLDAVISWAKENNLKRIELTVVTENESAVALYKRVGFEVEGIKRKSLLMEGVFYDEYYMGRLC